MRFPSTINRYFRRFCDNGKEKDDKEWERDRESKQKSQGDTHSRGERRGDAGKTRPDTRPSVADGWAGAEMRVFPLFDSSMTD